MISDVDNIVHYINLHNILLLYYLLYYTLYYLHNAMELCILFWLELVYKMYDVYICIFRFARM